MKELELLFGTKLLDSMLASPEDAICTLREVKSCLIEADWKRTISMASAHPSLAYICDPQFVNEWLALWDCALDYGTLGTKVSQTVLKIMCKPVFGDDICCYCSNTIDEPSFLSHLTVAHALDQHTLFSSLSTNKTALFLPPLSRLI